MSEQVFFAWILIGCFVIASFFLMIIIFKVALGWAQKPKKLRIYNSIGLVLIAGVFYVFFNIIMAYNKATEVGNGEYGKLNNALDVAMHKDIKVVTEIHDIMEDGYVSIQEWITFFVRHSIVEPIYSDERAKLRKKLNNMKY